MYRVKWFPTVPAADTRSLPIPHINAMTSPVSDVTTQGNRLLYTQKVPLPPRPLGLEQLHPRDIAEVRRKEGWDSRARESNLLNSRDPQRQAEH